MAEVSKVLVRLPIDLRKKLDEHRGDVPLNTAIIRAIEAAVEKDERHEKLRDLTRISQELPGGYR